ncbi:MAG: PAS domain S-box protein [Desulfobacteraceae bacterium]|jgi:PAS domain S-box-containing protein
MMFLLRLTKYKLHRYLKFLIPLLFIGLLTPNSRAENNKRVEVLHSCPKGLTWTDSITKGIEATFSDAGIPPDIECAYMDTTRVFNKAYFTGYGLKRFRLPSDGIAVNQNKTFYSQHKKLFWTILAIFLSMTTIIIFLVLAIVSRRKAERALVASKNRYQNVFNSTSVALFEVDFSAVSADIEQWALIENKGVRAYLEEHPQAMNRFAGKMRIKDVNPAALSLFKAPDKAALIHALCNNHIFDQSVALKEIVIALAEKRDRFVWEKAVKSLNGDWLHVILSLNIPENPKSYRNLVVSVFDITDRKLSEEALRRSEDRFRTIFNQAASGMALVDLDGAYLRVNSTLCRMLGYSEQELLQRTWQDITHEDDISLSMNYGDQALASTITQPIEKRYLQKSGQVVHVLLNLAAIRDEEGRPVYLIAQFQDISQIKAAQAALKEREERYRQFFEGDLSGVYVSTPEGNLIMCNEVFAKILGFGSSEEVIGTLVTNFYKNPAQRSMLVSQLTKDRRIDQYELELVRKDGAMVQCLINAMGQFNEQGELIEIQGYLMDITRMKSLEKQLLHAQKMESIGTMAGGVAHDFNNLLMGIMGNTSLMLIEKDSSELSRKRLKNIEQLVESGSDLTRQLLGFAKGGKYEVRTTDLNKLILRSVNMFARTHKGIIVHTKLSEELMLVEADCSQIDQVFYNLYLNAFQAMKNGGRIDIQTRNQTLDKTSGALYGLAAGDYVQVSVQDDGTGMDSKTQQRIFDPFFTTKERERGTGLGLASVYGIIQNHAGSITVKSQPDKGTCFTIFLPVSKNIQVEMAPAASSRLIKGSETIFLVDDEQSILDAVGNMLSYLGYTVRTASDGKTAIEIFRQDHQNIDLVILDMVMPGVGGKEAFESFKKIDPDVKVLLCSGYTANGQAAGIIEGGCQGFIQKPFTINQLSQKLSRAFQHKP